LLIESQKCQDSSSFRRRQEKRKLLLKHPSGTEPKNILQWEAGGQGLGNKRRKAIGPPSRQVTRAQSGLRLISGGGNAANWGEDGGENWPSPSTKEVKLKMGCGLVQECNITNRRRRTNKLPRGITSRTWGHANSKRVNVGTERGKDLKPRWF